MKRSWIIHRLIVYYWWKIQRAGVTSSDITSQSVHRQMFYSEDGTSTLGLCRTFVQMSRLPSASRKLETLCVMHKFFTQVLLYFAILTSSSRNKDYILLFTTCKQMNTYFWFSSFQDLFVIFLSIVGQWLEGLFHFTWMKPWD